MILTAGIAAAAADAPTCNWGELTAESIAAGFEQGPHSSDPSGDGHGPGTLDEPRAGLANVVAQGDLDATCVLIDSLLP
jgi:hypothetical protein